MFALVGLAPATSLVGVPREGHWLQRSEGLCLVFGSPFWRLVIDDMFGRVVLVVFFSNGSFVLEAWCFGKDIIDGWNWEADECESLDKESRLIVWDYLEHCMDLLTIQSDMVEVDIVVLPKNGYTSRLTLRWDFYHVRKVKFYSKGDMVSHPCFKQRYHAWIIGIK